MALQQLMVENLARLGSCEILKSCRTFEFPGSRQAKGIEFIINTTQQICAKSTHPIRLDRGSFYVYDVPQVRIGLVNADMQTEVCALWI